MDGWVDEWMDGFIEWPTNDPEGKLAKSVYIVFRRINTNKCVKICSYIHIHVYIWVCICIYTWKVSSVYINVSYIVLENSCTLLERVWNGTFFCGRQFGNFYLKTKCISIGPAFPPLGFMLLKFPKMVDSSTVGRKTGANEMPNNGGLDARKHSGSEVDRSF